jgi:holo-[acyl-carrier protein] synthase
VGEEHGARRAIGLTIESPTHERQSPAKDDWPNRMERAQPIGTFFEPSMKILGLGVDLADIERINSVLSRYPRFAERCFTPHEREYAFRYARPERRLAARFAGKEAVMKSMGTGWRRISWRDIEITGGGKPTVRMSGRAADRAELLGITEVLVTITHTDTSALVMAVAVGEHD